MAATECNHTSLPLKVPGLNSRVTRSCLSLTKVSLTQRCFSPLTPREGARAPLFDKIGDPRHTAASDPMLDSEFVAKGQLRSRACALSDSARDERKGFSCVVTQPSHSVFGLMEGLQSVARGARTMAKGHKLQFSTPSPPLFSTLIQSVQRRWF